MHKSVPFALCSAAAIALAAPSSASNFRLTVLHTNDTESKLLYPSSSQQAFGGAANTCNTVASGVFVKYTCVTSTADPTAADLPTGFATIS